MGVVCVSADEGGRKCEAQEETCCMCPVVTWYGGAGGTWEGKGKVKREKGKGEGEGAAGGGLGEGDNSSVVTAPFIFPKRGNITHQCLNVVCFLVLLILG